VKHLYLDWSGDAGFKFRRGSSRYLTIARVTGETPLDTALGELRARYSLGRAFYFRFTHASEFIKPIFFSAVGLLDLRGVVLRVNKTRLPPAMRQQRGTDLLSLFAAETVVQMPVTAGQDRVLIFDGLRAERSLGRAMRVAVSARVREKDLPPVRRVVARPARDEAGLQVADMLAGAAASEHLAENALLGRLGGKVVLIDYAVEKQKGPG
jgi:hypothetical protein